MRIGVFSDIHANLEALSAVLGGCDSLTITPCGFDAHLAENVHHILREESHLDKVIDPGAGSYYVEALTDALSAEAWALFQAIEAGGGAPTDSGSPRAESWGGWRSYRISGALAAALGAARAQLVHQLGQALEGARADHHVDVPGAAVDLLLHALGHAAHHAHHQVGTLVACALELAQPGEHGLLAPQVEGDQQRHDGEA